MPNVVPVFTYAENIFNRYSVLFTLIVMYQGLFGGMSLQTKPILLQNLSKNMYFKYFTLFCIAFSATKDVEISLMSIVAFVILMNFARTPEEREKYGYFNL